LRTPAPSRCPIDSTQSTLTAKQVSVIEALASGATLTDAAKKAEVDRTTVYLWMRKDDLFVAELNRSRREVADAMRAQLGGLAWEAIRAVREVLTGADIPAVVRLKAALAVLQSVCGHSVPSIGPTDPETIESNRRNAELMESLGSL
jgi:hypothetical protein